MYRRSPIWVRSSAASAKRDDELCSTSSKRAGLATEAAAPPRGKPRPAPTSRSDRSQPRQAHADLCEDRQSRAVAAQQQADAEERERQKEERRRQEQEANRVLTTPNPPGEIRAERSGSNPRAGHLCSDGGDLTAGRQRASTTVISVSGQPSASRSRASTSAGSAVSAQRVLIAVHSVTYRHTAPPSDGSHSAGS